jgi:hypothetical protein
LPQYYGSRGLGSWCTLQTKTGDFLMQQGHIYP